MSETGNDFDTLNWTVSTTSDVVDCTGKYLLHIPHLVNVSGAKTSTFNYTTLSRVHPAISTYNTELTVEHGLIKYIL